MILTIYIYAEFARGNSRLEILTGHAKFKSRHQVAQPMIVYACHSRYR